MSGIIANLNLTFIAVVILLIAMSIQGYIRGMVRTILSVLATVVFLVMVVIVIYGARQLVGEKYVFFAIAVVLFLGIVFIGNLGKMLVSPLRMLSSITIVKQLDKIAGVFFGAFEGVLYVWTVFLFVGMLSDSVIAAYIQADINGNGLLSFLSRNNYIVTWYQALF